MTTATLVRHAFLPIALASISAGLCLPAHAASGSADDRAEAVTGDASGSAPESGFADGGAEIRVTARRRDEDPAKVPGAISVVDGARLDRSYTINTQGLSLLVPALNYSSANPRNTAFTIRGLGSSVVAISQANDGLEPGVGYYVDQVYHARPATAAFDFSDIDHVEVLRGPQGTLFGKNSTAGAISITTRPPTFEPEFQEELSIGSRLLVQAKAAASGALIGDTVAGRIAAVVTRRNGVIHDVKTGADLNSIANQAVRGQLLFRPATTLQLRLSADFANFEGVCCTQVYYRVAPTLKATARQYAALAAGLPGGAYTPASLDPYDRLTDIDAALGVKTSEGGVSAIADWNFGPATLTSVSAWRFWNWDAANDRDYTGIPIQTTQHIPSRQDQYSEELRIASNGEHAISYVGGLYFFRQRVTGRPISIYGPQATYWLLGGPSAAFPANLLDGYGSDGHTDFRSRSYAAFGEVNWRLLPRLTLTGGLRQTWERKTGSYDTFTFGGPSGLTAAQVNSQLSVLRGQTYSARISDGSLTGRANLAWQASDAILGYASFARGAKSGGINMSGLPLDNANQPALSKAVVKPERNTNYEVGIKSRLFGRRVTLDIDGFYTRVVDFQANVTDTGAAAALRTYLANIPKVAVKGFEADLGAIVAKGYALRASVAYADGRYLSYPNAPCPIERISSATTVCDLTGKALPSLPKWSYTLGGDATQPVAGIDGSLLVHAEASIRTRQFGDPTDSAYTTIGGYMVVNGSVGYRSNKGWGVAIFARNMFDADYVQNVTIQAGNSGLILATPSDPRTIGLTLRFEG